MTQALEKISALNKKQMEIAVQAFQIGFNAWESLIKLNLEAARSLLQEGAGSIERLGSARDVSGISAWTGAQFRAGAERLSGYSRNLYEIGGQASGAWGDLLEQTLLSNNQDVVEWIDEMLKSSPIQPQPEAAAAAAKAAMANAKSVIEGISKVVRQTAGYADANVRAAAAATAEAVKNTAK
jgi:phasin family protein